MRRSLCTEVSFTFKLLLRAQAFPREERELLTNHVVRIHFCKIEPNAKRITTFDLCFTEEQCSRKIRMERRPRWSGEITKQSDELWNCCIVELRCTEQ